MWPPSSSNPHHYSQGQPQGQPQQQQQQPSSPSQQHHHHHLQTSTDNYRAAAAAAAAYGRYDGYDDIVNYENTELLQRMMVAAAVQQQQQQQQQENLEEVIYQQHRQEAQHHQQLFQQQQQQHEYSAASMNLNHDHPSIYPYHHVTQPQTADEEEEEEEEMTSFPQGQIETVRTSTPPQSVQPPHGAKQLNRHLQNQLDSGHNLQNEVEEKENEEDEEENMMPYTGMIQSSPLVPSSNQHQYHGIVAASKELRQEQLINENNKGEYEDEDEQNEMEEEEEDSCITPSAPSPPMETHNISTTTQSNPSVLETLSTPINEPLATTNTPPKSNSSSKKKKKKPKTVVKNKKTLPTQSRIPSQDTSSQVILLESLKNTATETTMTEAEYNNLYALMHQFCRVPLLAEFSRPISLLHPELVAVYSKVISHPCDLGKVCRAIRRKQYQTTRQVCLDVWRIFANCVKYHTHSITKEYGAAIPSFISIALHLRDYFNSLWQEFMIPSELTPEQISSGMPYNVNLYQARDVQRRERLNATCTTILSSKCLEKTSDAIVTFLQLSGRVDHLDEESLLDKVDEDENDAVQAVFSELEQLIQTLRSQSEEYTMDMLDRDLKRCYSTHVFDDLPLLRQKIAIRLDRLLQKTVVPIHETNCRGVNQSSIWGCMAAAIWARESTKRPFWPALVMGILAPNDQTEDWHKALTDRNEARLPEKIRKDLSHGKKKALQTLAKQAEGQAERMSFFLVEFLGSHEFIWVREADILEHFDPNVDPNTGNKKSSKTKQAKHFIRALEEGRWALEEFELQLSDPCGDLTEETNAQNNDGGEHEVENYSFHVLCESDDEADEADAQNNALSNSNKKTSSSSQMIQTPTGELSDIEEVHELLATDGLLDYSMEGRKNAKRRAQALKKHQADNKKKTASSTKKKKSISPKKTNNNVSVGTSTTPSSSSKKKKTSPKSTPATTTSTTSTTPSSSKKMEREKQWEEKRTQKELEKRRKKRERERERCLREQERKEKRRKQLSDHGLNRTGRRLGINDKRGRAHSIVRGYLQRQQLRQNNGVNSMSAAGVEATGLLGMALAFRAAAGEISMPNDLDNASGFRPWERIQISSSLTSQERCDAYEEKIRLLQVAIDKFTKDDERRLNLIEHVKQQKKHLLDKIFADEKEARKNVLPKKKRVIKSAKQTKQENTAKDDGDEDDEDDEKQESVNISNTTNSNNVSGIPKTTLNEAVIQPQIESDSDDDGDDEEENEITSVKIANDDSVGDNDDEVEEDDDNRGAYDLSENSQSSDSE